MYLETPPFWLQTFQIRFCTLPAEIDKKAIKKRFAHAIILMEGSAIDDCGHSLVRNTASH